MRKKAISICILVFLCIYIVKIDMNSKKIETLTYNIPLEEIADKVQYIHKREHMLNGAQTDYGELGELEKQGTENILLYAAEGNKILFLPEDKANTEIMINDDKCKVYYSEETEGYLFYLIEDWTLHEGGVPVNSYNSADIEWCTVGKNDEKQEYDLGALSYLGKVQVNWDMDNPKSIPNVDMEENEYVNVMLGHITETLKEKQKYGSYNVYVYSMKRIADKYGGTNCCIKAVIVGEGIREYAVFIVYDNVDIEGLYSLSGPFFEDSQGYFSDGNLGEEYEYLVSEIIKLGKNGIRLEITESKSTDTNEKMQLSNNIDSDSGAIFQNISAYEAAKWIGYICSYCELFGMGELGYSEGEIREFNNKKMIMYTWKNWASDLLFVPMDKVNTFIQVDDDKKYPVYINKDGNIEFYRIAVNPYVSNEGQLKTTLITTYQCWPSVIDSLIKVGEEEVKLTEISKLKLPPVEEDEYTLALENYVKKMLVQSGKHGRYDIWIGEYEAVHTNKVCISAAIIGEQEYYVRYLIVKYDEDKYYFWPIGFGLDGSLEECMADSHKMNKICIERIRKLKKRKICSIF